MNSPLRKAADAARCARRAAAGAAGSLCMALAAAQGAAPPPFTHTVTERDTLIGIAARYLGDPAYWVEVQRANPGIRNERRLQPGSRIVIPVLGAGTGAIAVHVNGKASYTRFGQTRELVKDTELLDSDAVDVQDGSYVTLRWPEGIVTHLLPGSRLRIVPAGAKALRAAGPSPVVRTAAGGAEPAAAPPGRPRALELLGGTVESQVPKEDPPRNFQIRTRVGAAAVRGTQFGVRLSPQGAMVTEVTEGGVELAGAGFQPVQLPAGTGAVADGGGRQPQATAMLPAPALDEPLVLTPETELQAPAVAGAGRYEFELATPAAGTAQPPAALRRVSSDTPSCARRPIADGSYRVSLRAVDAQGIPGLPAVRTLTVITIPAPFLSEPANDATLAVDLPARLLCSDIPQAARYEIEIRSLDSPQAPPRRLVATGSCEVQLPGLPLGRYEWRAVAVRELPGGRLLRGTPSAAGRFTLVPRPAVPALRVGGGQDLRLMWEGVPDATYVVQLARDIKFRSMISETRVEVPEVTLKVPTGLAYFVRIRTVAGSGMASDFSPARIVRGPPWLGSTDGAPVRDSAGNPLAPQSP